MKIYLEDNVFDAALKRIEWIFNEFENVYVNFSGGKDSTVIMNLCLIVAAKLGRLPINLFFIDQEAEWQSVIDYIRLSMSDERINPLWLQVPIKLFNATSTIEPWLYCWEEGREWVRSKEPFSIKENVYGTDRFGELFTAYTKHHHPGEKCCRIAGVRTEESPARLRGLTSYETYKGETWGKVENKRIGHYVLYPIYDWGYTDVWKAIHDNGWHYCRLYDYMYQYGIPTREMRVSNVHHETAVKSLYFLQEIEAETWERITNRISGMNTASQLQKDFLTPKELPYMFSTWKEYRDYLLDVMLVDKEQKAKLSRQFAAHENKYVPEVQEELNRAEVGMILVNDYHGTKITTFHAAHGMDTIKYRQEKGLPTTGALPKGYQHESK